MITFLFSFSSRCLYVDVRELCSCPCLVFLSMYVSIHVHVHARVQFHVYARWPGPCPMSMSMYMYVPMVYVHVYARCSCPCPVTMSMTSDDVHVLVNVRAHAHVRTAGPKKYKYLKALHLMLPTWPGFSPFFSAQYDFNNQPKIWSEPSGSKNTNKILKNPLISLKTPGAPETPLLKSPTACLLSPYSFVLSSGRWLKLKGQFHEIFHLRFFN